MKIESKCGRRGLKGWLICVSDLLVPGTFSSVPTIATFSIRSRAKFPELLTSNRNQSVISGFPLGGFRLTAPWAWIPDPLLILLSVFSFTSFFTSFLITLRPSKFPCLGQKKLKYDTTYPCSNGFLQSFIKLRSHTKGANVHAGKLRNKWFGPYQVQYLLPNNTVLLVVVDKFDPDPVIVNINKQKTYRCPEEGLPDLSSSDHQTKTQLMEASFQNEDEPTGNVGIHSVVLVSVTQPVPNPRTVLHLDTSLPNPSHQQPQRGNLHSISTSLPFKMARVSTRAPYQPRPRTITTPKATAILPSFTFLQLSRLRPSNSPLSAQRVVKVPIVE